jgi:hypothetical protein
MKNLILMFSLLLVFSGCDRDPLPSGVESNIQGNVSDKFNNIPFQNLKLKIAEYKSHFNSVNGASYEFIKWIDSTITDSNGDYSLNFKTTGSGDHYELHIEEKENLWTYYYNPIEIQKIGGGNFQNLDFLHLYPTKLIITLIDLETASIMVDISLFKDPQNIEMQSGQVERIIYITKHTEEKITFRMKNINNVYDKSYSITVPASNTVNLNEYNITLNSSDFK